MATHTFLGIPPELRLAIYDAYLAEHQRVRQNRQPTNEHIRVLHTCTQIDREARPLFRRYISLRHERQINAFILRADDAHAGAVLWADVANDGRVLVDAAARGSSKSVKTAPLSHLYAALRRMISLKRLRVFQCRQGVPVNRPLTHVAMQFEVAMYPDGGQPHLSAYELHLDAETRVSPFEVISPRDVEQLRLSGNCQMPTFPPTPALRNVVLHGITGNAFDNNAIDKCFSQSRLESFSYGMGDKLGFELRDRHIQSLVSLSGARLRRLVLLECNRLSSKALAECLDGLPHLEYFALHIITVEELRSNFVLSLAPSVQVLKLHVINAWYAVPLLAEERGLCDAVENAILDRTVAPVEVSVHFRELLMKEDGRQARWQEIATQRQIQLSFGRWEDREQLEL
ncbi:hypothetical protein IEO21_00047 [Rhodonia placenta]|uniref:F-box domain-containing protein n=2 Tax=Rhodonia placenta TaxID=104341 RepID=A0A1X6NFM2_9APHY|nr:hypothetical protein POSPLADRAFT_1128113 [Postia placenta MAD-698-R-SB12]KAF9822053.1 hypothetical protein IEO21_00047 [Postia placenta]OSX67437.1 hypothetical protein POSPLADRAFT_1128113 [Postia placenta MAD-698-R-SB12]